MPKHYTFNIQYCRCVHFKSFYNHACCWRSDLILRALSWSCCFLLVELSSILAGIEQPFWSFRHLFCKASLQSSATSIIHIFSHLPLVWLFKGTCCFWAGAESASVTQQVSSMTPSSSQSCLLSWWFMNLKHLYLVVSTILYHKWLTVFHLVYGQKISEHDKIDALLPRMGAKEKLWWMAAHEWLFFAPFKRLR